MQSFLRAPPPREGLILIRDRRRYTGWHILYTRHFILYTQYIYIVRTQISVLVYHIVQAFAAAGDRSWRWPGDPVSSVDWAACLSVFAFGPPHVRGSFRLRFSLSPVLQVSLIRAEISVSPNGLRLRFGGRDSCWMLPAAGMVYY